MELAHAGDDHLAGVLVVVGTEGGVFLREPLEALSHAVLVFFRLRLDSDGDDGLREGDRLEDDRGIGVAKGIAGEGLFEADGGGDVPGIDIGDVLSMVGVHAQEPAEALLLTVGAVQDGRTLGGMA